jgi:hypothetical protein
LNTAGHRDPLGRAHSILATRQVLSKARHMKQIFVIVKNEQQFAARE